MTKLELSYWRRAVMKANWDMAVDHERDTFFYLWHGALLDEGRA